MSEKVQAVKYVGVATVRRVTEAEWQQAGVKSQPTVQWDKTNGYTVLGKHLKPDAVKCLRVEEDFVVLTEEEEG